MTFVKVKLSLARMQTGEKLDILMRTDETLENIPKALREQGHLIHEIFAENDLHHVIVEKV